VKRRLALGLILSLIVIGCSDRDTARPANLILITIDTLRADFLGCYGYPDPVSPHLDRLAGRALVFDEAYATAPFTGPSHASILTGQHPSAHGVIYNGHRARNLAIGEQSVTVAEHLAQLGFATKAVVSAGPLAARFGFGRGFESFNLVPKLGNPDSGGHADRVNRRAGNWLQDWKHTRAKERFFLWVHYFDPHLPFHSSPGLRDSLGITFAETVDDDNVGTLAQADIQQAYRAEVYQTDQFIGALIARLTQLELADDTVIAVVADHGEYLQEHGLVNHHGLFDEVLHVPMLIHWRGLEASERRRGTVSTIDLVPTLLDLLNVPALTTAAGRSLLQASTQDDPRPVFAEWRDFRLLADHEPQAGDFLISVQEGRRKLIRDVLFPAASRCYDLAADPDELTNLYGADAPLPHELGARLDRHLQHDLPAGLAGIADIQIDQKSLEMLRSLGYVR
jgi:arylsulfatase A-like enzyme